MDCLISPTSRSWDRDALFGYFAPMEADLILKIPLSPTRVEDKLIWPHVPNGVYSVKSGYRFLVKDKVGPLPHQSSQDVVPSIWSRIWKLSVPNKVKNFLWKACKEALPVKKNLVRRRVLEEDVCCHCKKLRTVSMLCGTVLSFQQFGKLTLCGYFAGPRSFQIFLSLQDSCWRMTKNQNCLQRSRGQSGLAGTNFEPAISHSC